MSRWSWDRISIEASSDWTTMDSLCSQNTLPFKFTLKNFPNDVYTVVRKNRDGTYHLLGTQGMPLGNFALYSATYRRVP